MAKKLQFPTAKQNIAITLAFGAVGEQRYNRTLAEYEAIAAKLGPLKILEYKINNLLAQLHERSKETGEPLPEICRFKAGDERVVYEKYPTRISYETLRAALEVSGLRAPRSRRSNPL